MPRTSIVDSDKAKAAVSVLIRAPGITVREAMILAKFTDEEANTKSMQRKVSRDLQRTTESKGKGNATVSTADSVPPVADVTLNDGNESPHDVSSMTQEEWKPKKHRLNAKQKQEKREAELRAKAKFSRAHKAATKLYAAELSKGDDGMSSRKVEAVIKKKYKGVGPSHATIHHYVVTKGEIGMSPQKRGPIGHIPVVAYKSLCAGFATFIRINQLNCTGGVNHRGKMAPIVAETMMVDVETAREILKRLARDTAIDLGCAKGSFAEERRVRWTTYQNLELWFDTWERELLKLGLMQLDVRGYPHIPRDKLRQILNFDETSLSLDGSSINRGGRPAAYWFDPRLPQVGITTAKTSYSSTMITGSNAYGEALPPHFQFVSSAQTDDAKMITVDCIRYMKKVRGVFGMGAGASEESFGVTIGLNEKGGMDMEEFAKYLRNSIMPLYPNAAPEFGKWVILKCDSGPGRLNLDLLADLRSDGFILFPGVPNTTAVSQETDQNYGPFKTQYCKNLDAVVDERLKKGKPTAMAPWQVGLLVYGGTDAETGLQVTSAFDAGFSRDACRNAWDKVGAAPLTRAALENKKVRKSLGDGSAEYQAQLLEIQQANDIAVHSLTLDGYKGSCLQATILEYPKTEMVTEETDIAERLAKFETANTCGKLFSVNVAGHLTSDDMFLSGEKTWREKEKKRLTTEKNKRMRLMNIETKAKKVLEKKGDDEKCFLGSDLDAVLAYYNCPKRNTLANVEEKKRAWGQMKAKGLVEPAPCVPWTDEEELKLLEVSKECTDLMDTALGRAKRRKMSQCKIALREMSNEEFEELVASRLNAETAEPSEGASEAV